MSRAPQAMVKQTHLAAGSEYECQILNSAGNQLFAGADNFLKLVERVLRWGATFGKWH